MHDILWNMIFTSLIGWESDVHAKGLGLLFFEVIHQISWSHRLKKLTIWFQLEITRPVAAIKSLRFALFLLCMTLLRFLAVTKQLYDWFSPSVRPSVCPSITPFSPCSHHRIIMKFSGVITMDRGDVHAKGQGQRSKVKVTEVNTQLSRFRTLTPVWIHIWQWNHAHSCKQHRREVTYCFSRSSVKLQG